jgi:hypothetical protein
MNERTTITCWLISDVLLAIGLLYAQLALWAAIVFTATHNFYFLARRPQGANFTLQVRFVYQGLLIIGQLPYCRWIDWVQLAGTTALLTTGYCPLARILSLAPWNRTQPINLGLLRKAVFTAPVDGSILDVTTSSQTAIR